jgi:anti-sigma B factor antagonist
MTAPVAKILVAVSDSVVRARICGRANFASVVDFKSFILAMEKRGLHRFVLDLGDCQIMDSTFVGFLASLGSRMEDAGDDHFVEILNPNERINELLDSLGIADMFRIDTRDIGSMPACEEIEASGEGHTKAEMSRTSLEAHRKLMELNPDNVAKFKDVTQFLEEDLKRLEGSEGAGA